MSKPARFKYEIPRLIYHHILLQKTIGQGMRNGTLRIAPIELRDYAIRELR